MIAMVTKKGWRRAVTKSDDGDGDRNHNDPPNTTSSRQARWSIQKAGNCGGARRVLVDEGWRSCGRWWLMIVTSRMRCNSRPTIVATVRKRRSSADKVGAAQNNWLAEVEQKSRKIRCFAYWQPCSVVRSGHPCSSEWTPKISRDCWN